MISLLVLIYTRAVCSFLFARYPVITTGGNNNSSNSRKSLVLNNNTAITVTPISVASVIPCCSPPSTN